MAGTTGGRWQVRAADGTVLHGRVLRAPHERAAMLLSHGLAEHLGRYENLTRSLLAAGVSVLAYDHRGHGRSPGRRATVDVETLVRDHLAVRHQAGDLLRGVPLFLHGHSLGGAVTAASVLRRPGGTVGALLSSPGLSVAIPVSPLTRLAGQALAVVAPGAGTVRLPSSAVSRRSEVVAAYDADPLVFHGRTPARTAMSLLTMGEQVLARAGRWAVPALVVHGTADGLTDIGGSRAFVAAAGTDRTPRPPVRLVEVPDGYHELYNDEAAAEVLAETHRWIDERLAAGSTGAPDVSRA